MNFTIKPNILTYLGAIPFIVSLLIAAYGFFEWAQYFNYEVRFSRFKSYAMAHTYGAVIVGFLGGIQWGISLNQPADKQFYISSNILALIAWLSLFAFASFIGVMIITLCFLLALFIDHKAHRNLLLPDWFWRLRKTISIVVVSNLTLLLILNQ